MNEEISLPVKVGRGNLVDALMNLDLEELLDLLMKVCDEVAMVEFDEELIARLWHGLDDCYDEEDDRPDLQTLLERYPKQA